MASVSSLPHLPLVTPFTPRGRYYCATGKLPWAAASAADAHHHEWRSTKYKEVAERFLPEILALGKQVRISPHISPSMAFHGLP